MPDGDRSTLSDGLRMPAGILDAEAMAPSFLLSPEGNVTGVTIGEPENRAGEYP